VNIAITGGTGFLGTAIVRHLCECGDDVRVIVRPTSRADRLPDAVTTTVADIRDRAQLREAFAGVEGVIHAAALVSNWGRRWAEFERVNVEAPVIVCEAAVEAGARTVVHVSSFLALGTSEDERGVNEATRHDPRHVHNHYERSKMLGDARVRDLAARGLPVVIVYPGVLYGPGPATEGNFVGRLRADLAAGRVPGMIGSGDQRWSFAHVDDVAAGIRLALTVATPGSRYVLGGDNASMTTLFALLAAMTGAEPPRRHIGRRLAWLAAALGELRARATGRVPTLTRDAVAIFLHDWACDSSAAVRDLGYTFRPLADGLHDDAWETD